MPPKRKRAADKADANPAPAKQVKDDGQRAPSNDLFIPLDPVLRNKIGDSKHKIYVDDDGIIYDASLNQSNIRANNNKFYILQLLKTDSDQFYTYTRWGRVGENGQDKMLNVGDLDDALKDFQKKFKDKSGLHWDDRDADAKPSKYTFIQKNYDDDEGDSNVSGALADVKKEEKQDDWHVKPPDEPEEPPSKLPVQTQRLISLIFDEAHFNSVLENIGYNNDKLPLGKLSKMTITKGFQHLKELASLIKHPSLAQNKYQITRAQAIEDFTNRYYSVIPHAFGRNRPPMVDNWDILQREVAMLDTLSDMEIANEIMKTTHDKARNAEAVNLIDERFAKLQCDDLSPLDHDTAEYKGLQKYLISTVGHTHSIRFRLQDIFRVRRRGEDDRFNESKYVKRPDKNRRLLWHGSRTTNFGGILSQGLRIAPPEAPVNGYAFAKGVYMADVSTKSANYCMTHSSGGHGLLLLCEAELGNPMLELLGGDSLADEKCLKQGSIATLGIGRTIPQGWVDAGVIHKDLEGVMMPDTDKPPADQTLHPSTYLQYNEYIVYDVAQVRLRYLLRFST